MRLEENGTGPSNLAAASAITGTAVPDLNEEVMDLARETVAGYASSRDAGSSCRHDAGAIVAAALLAGIEPTSRELAETALERWLDELPDDFAGIGPFGGLGGFIAGLRAATTISSEVATLHRAVLARAPDWLGQVEWRSSRVAWRDYDFFTGPAGVILAGADADCPPGTFAPALRHLLSMCAGPGLEAFRAGEEIDARSAFNIGRINTGLGHGLAGVAAALNHAVLTLEGGRQCLPALRKACNFLVGQAIIDARGLSTWPPVGLDWEPPPAGFNQRQAWCYGTPGVAWTLWDAAQTLEDPSLARLALAAMESFCDLFDADLYIDDAPASESLSLCHGVAGTIAVADAFARHAGLKKAGRLRADLTRLLLARRDEVARLRASDMTMLSGAGGIAAVLLTQAGGDRRWLAQIALR